MFKALIFALLSISASADASGPSRLDKTPEEKILENFGTFLGEYKILECRQLPDQGDRCKSQTARIYLDRSITGFGGPSLCYMLNYRRSDGSEVGMGICPFTENSPFGKCKMMPGQIDCAQLQGYSTHTRFEVTSNGQLQIHDSQEHVGEGKIWDLQLQLKRVEL